jgi:murein DD-endopeptidase MepM/ murein hydrolase activator NlpD
MVMPERGLFAPLMLASLLVALAATPARAVAQSQSQALPAEKRIAAPARLRQGDPLLAWIVAEAPGASQGASAHAFEARLIDAAGKIVARARCFAAPSLYENDPRIFGALMALPRDIPPGVYALTAGASATSLTIEPRSFPAETIRLDEANARLRTEPSERKLEEARKLIALLSRIDPGAVYAGPSSFMFPAAGGWKSAGFGDVRRYRYPDGGADESVHAGLDWALVAGTAVHACARGKVVMAADRELTGKTLVIEHLPGLYSLYMHLSAIEAKEGDIVERAARVAFSGSTGMSTGPHLHWELRAGGDAVDPEYWLGAVLLDKSSMAAIMHGLIEGR